MRREVLTAKSLSRNLKEHEEAFKSRNGYEVEPPPMYGTEISGIIAEVMKNKHVTQKEIQEAGRLIRIASEKKILLNVGSRMVYKAMGYVDFQDAKKRNEGKDYFENLNFDRKDLNAVHAESVANEKAIKDKVKEQIRPYFEKVFALPWEPERFQGKAKSSGEVMAKVHVYMEELGWVCEDHIEYWDYGHAFAYRYPSSCGMQVKKSMFRRGDFGSRRLIFEASRELAREIGWGPKPGEIKAKRSKATDPAKDL
jgi:hypothetical protein